MFFCLSHVFLGIVLVVQLSPSIAAPAPLIGIDASTALEARATDNSKISLYKNGLPEGNMTIPSTLDEISEPFGETSQPSGFALSPNVQSTEPEQNVAPPSTVRLEATRGLPANDTDRGSLVLVVEPRPTDEDEWQPMPFRRHLPYSGSGSHAPHGGSNGHNGWNPAETGPGSISGGSFAPLIPEQGARR